jgi:hypothetical protein
MLPLRSNINRSPYYNQDMLLCLRMIFDTPLPRPGHAYRWLAAHWIPWIWRSHQKNVWYRNRIEDEGRWDHWRSSSTEQETPNLLLIEREYNNKIYMHTRTMPIRDNNILCCVIAHAHLIKLNWRQKQKNPVGCNAEEVGRMITCRCLFKVFICHTAPACLKLSRSNRMDYGMFISEW